jgi:hypothetical protein
MFFHIIVICFLWSSKPPLRLPFDTTRVLSLRGQLKATKRRFALKMKMVRNHEKRWVLLMALVSALLLGASETYAFAQSTTTTSAKEQLRASIRSGAPTGQFTYQNKAGKTVTISYAKGQITAVNGTQLTLKETNGASQTFTLSANTKVKIDRKLDNAGDLQPGMKALLTSKQKQGQQPEVKRVAAHTPQSTSSTGTTSSSTASG